MSSLRWQAPDEGRTLLGRALALALVGCALWTGAVLVLLPVDISVEGFDVRVPAGTSVRDLIRDGLVAAQPGDVLGVRSGVARAHGGGAPVVMFDHDPVGADARVYPGVAVTSSRGRDTRERTVEDWVAVPPEVQTVGSGPDVGVLQIGSPGLVHGMVGEESHGVVATWSVAATAVPMIVERRPFTPGAKTVALTFDDGPWVGQTAQVLDILAAENVKATFFMNGVRIRMQPELARRVVIEGHLVGNHTQTHLRLGRATPSQVVYQLTAGRDTIRTYTGVVARYFRAPGGTVTPVVRREAQKLGERVIGWSVDPKDWQKAPAGKIANRVVGAVRPGAIVLLHDGGGDRSRTIAALPEIIRRLKEMGYRFVTLDDLYPTP
jgi:peptidoglycan/xylan/chitin deacetylase (PgdA/CDA1 family)